MVKTDCTLSSSLTLLSPGAAFIEADCLPETQPQVLKLALIQAKAGALLPALACLGGWMSYLERLSGFL